MKKRMKKRFIFIVVLVVIMLTVSLIFTAFSAKSYSLDVLGHMSETVVDARCETYNGNVEVSDITIEGDHAFVTVVPKHIGTDVVEFFGKTEGSTDEDVYYYMQFWSGPFNTIFCYNFMFDFKGGIYVILIALLTISIIAGILIYSFFDYLRRSEFGYPMVACGGVGLFFVFYIAANIVNIIYCYTNSLQFSVGFFFSMMSSSGGSFLYDTALFMAVFCIALMISNIWLIRHEGFRFVNLLGVALGVLWFTSFAVNMLTSFYISGSETEVKIYTSISNGMATIISYFECLLASTILSAFLASRKKPPLDRDYIVILGCAIMKDGSLTPILRGRVDAAIDFCKKQFKETGRSLKFVPSGGQGSDECISEGEAMERYLIEQGIDKEQILPEKKSTNTFENIKFSKEIIENDAQGEYNAAFATTNYHVFRGYILSDKHKLKNARGISSKTKWYFFPNAFLREFIGLMVDKWKMHVFFILLIVIALTVLNIITFY